MRARHVAQRQRAGEVVPVVLERLLHAFAHGLEAGEVNDGVDVVLGEHLVKGIAVKNIDLVELQLVAVGVDAGDAAHALDGKLARIAQVVHDDHAVSLLQQLHARVAADEAGAARDEHAGIGVLLGKALVRH